MQYDSGVVGPLLLSLFVIGFHTSFTVELAPSLPVPMTICGVTALIVTFLLPSRELLDISRPMTLYLLSALVVNTLAFDEIYWTKYVTGFVQLAYSLWIAQCTYVLVASIPPSKLALTCLALIGAVTALSVAELAPQLKEYMEIISGVIAPAGEANIERDTLLHGATRARALALEPSHAALTLSVLSYCFFWTGAIKRFYLLLWLVALLTSIWMIRSPIILVTLITAIGSLVMSQRWDRAVVGLFAACIGLAGLMIVFADAFDKIYLHRITAMAEGEGSFVMRLVAPFMFLFQKISENIIIGSGVVGNLEMYASEILSLYHGMGMKYITVETAGLSLTNNIALHFIFFGFAGGLISAWLLIAATRLDNPRHWFILLLQLLTLSLACGGYVAPRIWCMSAMLVAAARYAHRSCEARRIGVRRQDHAGAAWKSAPATRAPFAASPGQARAIPQLFSPAAARRMISAAFHGAPGLSTANIALKRFPFLG